MKEEIEDYSEDSEPESVDSSKKKKTFKCKLCKKVLALGSYSFHMAIHAKEVHKCNICNNTFGTRKYLLRHMRNMHTEKRHKYKCHECDKTFAFAAKLRTHAMVHTGEKPHECEVCGKCFRARYCFKVHMLIHEDQKPYSCADCTYTCRDSSTLRKHRAIHLPRAHPYQCTKCDKTYKMKWRLKTHIAEVHLGLNVRLTPCPHCTKMFRNASELSMHVRSVHDRAKVCKCDICGKYLSNVANMPAHLLTHSDLRPFGCTYRDCKLRFKTQGDLKRHSIVHNVRRKTPCAQCGRRFARVSALRRHETTQHVARRKDTPCKRCGVRFYNEKYLLKHMKQKHSPQRPHFECDLCGFRTANKPSIVMHIKHGHGNEKDLKCKICKRKYKRHVYLKMHYLKSHNLRYKPIQKKRQVDAVVVKEEPLDIEEHDLEGALEQAEVVADADWARWGEPAQSDKTTPTAAAEAQASGSTGSSSADLTEELALSIISDNVASRASLPERVFDDFFIRRVPTKDVVLNLKQDPDALEPEKSQRDKEVLLEEARARVIQESLETRQSPNGGEETKATEKNKRKRASYHRPASVISCGTCGIQCKTMAGYKSHVKTHSKVNNKQKRKTSKTVVENNNKSDTCPDASARRSKAKVINETHHRKLRKFYDMNVKDLDISFGQFVEICRKMKEDNNTTPNDSG